MWSGGRERARGSLQVLVTSLKSSPLLSTGILIAVPPCVCSLYWIPLFPKQGKMRAAFPFPHSPIDCLLNRLAFERGFISGSIKWAPKLTMNADFFLFCLIRVIFLCGCVTEKESEGGADRYCLSLLLLGSDCRDVCFWWLTAPCRPHQ